MMRLRHEDPCPPRQPVPRPYPRGLSCCSTPRCSCPATPPRAGKSPESCRRPRPVPLHQEPGSERRISRTRGAQLASDGPHLQLPTGAVVLLHAPLLVPSDAAARGKKIQGAAVSRAQCRCTKNRGQRGAAAAPEGRTWPPTAPTCSCPRGLSCCSTPRCSCPATPPRAGKSPESCRRPRPVPLHQEPGSERRISRTRGAQLASDGPHLQLPTGAVVLLHAPLLVPSDAAARGKKNPRSCRKPRPVPLH